VTKQKRLGRGLAALLGGPLDEAAEIELQEQGDGETVPFRPRLAEELSADSPEPQAPSGKLPIDQIDGNPFQPRHDFNHTEIESLAESLKTHDMLQPVVVRLMGERFQLISGERRLRAARLAGWSEIPAIVREADDRTVAELAIVENLQRQDLNPLEKAISFQRYLEEHHATAGELAQRINVDRSTVANLVRLLELPQPVKAAIHTGDLSAGHARALLPLGEEQLQCELAKLVIEEGLSVRATEEEVAQYLNGEGSDTAAAPKKTKRTKSQQIVSLEENLKMALGTRVEIKQAAKGGKIVIHFKDGDQFDRLNGHLLGEEMIDAA